MEGNNMKILGIAIAAAISIIVLGSVLMPVFSNVIDRSSETFSNVEGSQSFMEKITPATDSYTFVFDGVNNPGYITVNGVDVTPNLGTLFCVPNFGLIRNHTGSSGDDFTAVRLELISVSTVVTSVNITIQNGEGTLISSASETPVTFTLSSFGFGIVKEGNYVMTSADQHKYILGNSEIYAQGLTSITGGVWNTQLQLHGTKDAGISVNTVYPPSQINTTTFSNIAVNSSAVSGYTDLYDLQSITFNAKYSTNAPTSCTYDRVIIPAEVTAYTEGQLTDGQVSLLKAIPVMIIIGILMMVVGVIRTKEL